MRPVVLVGVALVLAGFIAFASRAAPPAANVIAPTPPPRATADPANTIAAEAFGAREAASSSAVGRPQTRVRGLLVPIEGAALPDDADLLPGAAREYRGGWHEGVDFPADAGTPVRAVAPGIVIRVDRDFTDWDDESRVAALEEAARLGYTPEATLDEVRGRQVWVDHGRGVVSRYAHLGAVADLVPGQAVRAGETVGSVGNSGLPSGGPHLHLEVRIGDGYLGEDLAGDALVRALARAFSP